MPAIRRSAGRRGIWGRCCDWKSLLLYAALTYGATYVVYLLTHHFFGEEGSVHIEVLLPAFVFGMVMKHGHGSSKADDRAATFIPPKTL